MNSRSFHPSVGRYFIDLKRHPFCAAFLVVLVFALTADALRREVLGRTTVYFSGIGLGVLIVDAITRKMPVPEDTIPVRSAGREIVLAGVSSLCAATFLVAHFVINYQPVSAGERLLFFAVGLGALFNVFLAVALVMLGYSSSELGLRTKGLLAAVPLITLFAGFSLSFARAQFFESLRLVGPAGPLAGISEEFFRFVWQTRLASLRGNPAAGWIAASSIWAALHVPVFWAGTHSALHATIGAVQILPLGLLFGYLTHRTRSFLPAALVHATNIWGLQILG